MWKDIKGFEGLYKVSTEGEVMSINTYAHKKPKILKPFVDSKNKYLYVTLSKNNKRYKFSIHRLVAQAFIPNPLNKEEVDHINNNPKDNNVNNLQWLSRKENTNKSFQQGKDQYRNCKISEVWKNEKYIKTFRSHKEASLFCQKEYGASYTSLQQYNKYKDIIIKPGKCND